MYISPTNPISPSRRQINCIHFNMQEFVIPCMFCWSIQMPKLTYIFCCLLYEKLMLLLAKLNHILFSHVRKLSPTEQQSQSATVYPMYECVHGSYRFCWLGVRYVRRISPNNCIECLNQINECEYVHFCSCAQHYTSV